MKVSISVKGRFHAFYLAEQLQKQNLLNQIITSYPKFETIKYGVEKNKINSLVLHELGDRIWRKIPQNLKGRPHNSYLLRELFDINASYKLKNNSDIFVGWSSNCLHSLRKAKKKGAITIVERGSSHILHQTTNLKEEYEKFGYNFSNTPQKVIDKELKEYKEADYISVPSTYVMRTFVERGIDENKIIKIPYGVNLNNFYPIEKQDNVFRVIYCGSLSLTKGLQYLLPAFTSLNLPNSELWLIGALTEEIKPLLNKYNNQNIFHKGPFPENELYKYYSQGSVFCFPSIDDGFGMVQAQAMACGLPLITTTNSGGEDLIDDSKEGFIIPIRSINHIKEKLTLLYEDRQLLNSMSNAAIAKVKRRYSWEEYGFNMTKVYNEILKNK
ncbi:glycosyltransferase family 4 protein [Priestia megaterium]|uniref:glycosyltransferase family 4 protein n=1 Tax=Priestia megaterium TaxID=1404 RepID=UPI00203AB283|nr:glycosyltransferase family 4 protein [Priestia megaterium]MCM3544957.1 glycosyltransferase family 4 protein [Priestia megaterium]